MKNQITKLMTTDLTTVKSTDALGPAYEKMKSSRIRHLPVLNENHQIAGIITDGNFQRAMNNNKSNDFGFRGDETVANYMSTEIRCVDPQAELAQVVKIMMDEKISSVLIVDDRNVIGIITTEDVLRMFFDLINSDRKTFTDSADRGLG